MQTLKLAEVKAAALKAHAEGRLLAQHARAVGGAYGYEAICTGTPLVCAIGAILDRDILDQIEDDMWQAKSIRAILGLMHEMIDVEFGDLTALAAIQASHDNWLSTDASLPAGVTTQCEIRFLELIQPSPEEN